jgi:hypothetical protein
VCLYICVYTSALSPQPSNVLYYNIFLIFSFYCVSTIVICYNWSIWKLTYIIFYVAKTLLQRPKRINCLTFALHCNVVTLPAPEKLNVFITIIILYYVLLLYMHTIIFNVLNYSMLNQGDARAPYIWLPIIVKH